MPVTISPFFRGEFGKDTVALGLADLLDHHLLGGLGSDSAQMFGINGLIAALSDDLAAAPIDVNDDIFFFTTGALGSHLKRGFDTGEDDFLGDVLLAMHDIDESKQLRTGEFRGGRFTGQLISAHSSMKLSKTSLAILPPSNGGSRYSPKQNRPGGRMPITSFESRVTQSIVIGTLAQQEQVRRICKLEPKRRQREENSYVEVPAQPIYGERQIQTYQQPLTSCAALWREPRHEVSGNVFLPLAQRNTDSFDGGAKF